MIPFQHYSSIPISSDERSTTGGKRRFANNINYYDHNILGLGNREAVTGTNLTSVVDKSTNKNHGTVNSIIKEARTPGQKPSIEQDMKSTYEASFDKTANPNSNSYPKNYNPNDKNKIEANPSPEKLCAGCYNCRIAKKQKEEIVCQKHPHVDPNIGRRMKAESELTKQQEIEKKLTEREALNRDSPDPNNKHRIAQKITVDHDVPEVNTYEYEGYGTDHQKTTANNKEKTRERIRQKVATQVVTIENNNKEKEKLMNLDIGNGGNLDLPSFRKSKSNKETYKKQLLDQIEADKHRKMANIDEDTKDSGILMEKLSKGYYVDKFSDRRANLKNEYYASVIETEQKKKNKLKEKEKDTNDMKKSVASYQRQLQVDKSKKEVSFKSYCSTMLLN